MKGYIPVEIPTKRYIKAYIVAQLGETPKLERGNVINNKLYDLLEHKQNNKKSEFNSRYNASIKFYISRDLYYRRGCNLNHNNIKNFNIFVEDIIKFIFRREMDRFIEMFPSFSAHLPELRKILGIDIEAWDDDSMRKDYYRYREKAKLPSLYSKTSGRHVPSEAAAHAAF